MDVRLAQVLGVLALLSCTACDVLPAAPFAEPAPAASSGATSRPATPTQAPTTASDAPSPEFTSPSRAVASAALCFARGVANYDSVREGRRDFLRDLQPFSTASERAALAGSPRAHLHWRVLRDRHERAHFDVLGVDRKLQPDGSVMHVLVTGVVRTRSDLAATRAFATYSLTLVRRGTRWQVTTAEGPGL